MKEDVNGEPVIVVADGDSYNFENVDDEVDVEATPVDEDVQTLPGQACYLECEY